MWAAIRLIRATRVFAVIFLSYIWALSWARLWPTRCDTSEKWKKIHKKNAPNREDIATWFDWLDLDDYVTFGGKP